MAGILNVDTVRNTSNRITLTTAGSIVGWTQVFFPDYVNFTTGTGTSGVELWPLAMSYTPKNANNKLIMEWILGGEDGNNDLFVVYKNGSIITDSGEQGYNNQAGLTAWSGLTATWYDNNTDTTPSNFRLYYHCTAGSTATRTYAPGIKSSDATNNSYRLNRYYTTASENTVSYGYLFEIAV